jgi:predicted HTH domain antitoxin
LGMIHIDLPESLLLSTGQSREEFVREAKFLLALKLFELGRLSSGRAAEICELPRIDFLLRAGRLGIPVADLDEEELDREFAD